MEGTLKSFQLPRIWKSFGNWLHQPPPSTFGSGPPFARPRRQSTWRRIGSQPGFRPSATAFGATLLKMKWQMWQHGRRAGLPSGSTTEKQQEENLNVEPIERVGTASAGPFTSNWHRVEAVFNRHFDNPDMQAVKAVLGSYAAHAISGQPVWPLLVGPPGSLKTGLLMSLHGLPETHFIDQLTPKTFISGYKPDGDDSAEETPGGLLFRIGSTGKIICPDFSTILAINRDHRASIFSDLRRIYDGMLRKEFGNSSSGDAKFRTWRGRITFMAACTGEIDRHYAVFSSLGERFLLIRWPRARMEAAQKAVKQNMELVQREVVEVAHPLFDNFETTDPADPVVPAALEEEQIPALGDFIAYCRSHVVRDSRGSRDIIDVPEAESATRISQQLCQLAKGCARLDRRSVVNEQDWAVVVRVAFDCMPPARRKILDSLTEGSDGENSLPPTTRRYACQDLMALGVLERDRCPRGPPSSLSKQGWRKAHCTARPSSSNPTPCHAQFVPPTPICRRQPTPDSRSSRAQFVPPTPIRPRAACRDLHPVDITVGETSCA